MVFRLKFATNAFLPALADPYAWIYKKEILDKDPHWYEKNILGSGPFKFAGYEIGQSIKGVRNPDYYIEGTALSRRLHRHLCRQAGGAGRGDPRRPRGHGIPRPAAVGARSARQGARRQDRGAGERLELRQSGDPESPEEAVRRCAGAARAAAGDRQWHGAPALAKIANVHTVGGIVFPGSPLAATKEELQEIAGFWPDIEKSRAEAKRLLKEAGAEGLKFELMNRNVDQPYKYVGTWLIDEWSKIGLHVTQRWCRPVRGSKAMRNGNFDVTVDFNCQGVVNPLLDVSKFLPHSVYTENYGNYEDQKEIDLYQQLLHETDFAKQRALMREFEKYVLDTEAHDVPDAVVVPDHSLPVLREGLEDQPEPLPQSGLGDRLAR